MCLRCHSYARKGNQTYLPDRRLAALLKDFWEKLKPLVMALGRLFFRALIFYVAFGLGMIAGSAVASVTLWAVGLCGS
jgi:hypothetical protein